MEEGGTVDGRNREGLFCGSWGSVILTDVSESGVKYG